MYDRYAEYWGLDNLIWLLGYSHMDYEWGNPLKAGIGVEKWNPGGEYYDMIGADTYKAELHSKLNTKINKINNDNKPTAYHECGVCPTVEELKRLTGHIFDLAHRIFSRAKYKRSIKCFV